MTPYQAVVTVPTAGTPVQLPAPTGASTWGGVCMLLVKPLKSNSGASCYVGLSATFDKAGGNGLITDLSITQSFVIETEDATDRIFPLQYWVDVDTNGDKLLVSWWVG